LAYAIGKPEPVSITVFHYGTANNGLTNKDLGQILEANFDFRPGQIIRELGLRRPIYHASACYGHFGREPTNDGQFAWEQPRMLKLPSKAA